MNVSIKSYWLKCSLALLVAISIAGFGHAAIQTQNKTAKSVPSEGSETDKAITAEASSDESSRDEKIVTRDVAKERRLKSISKSQTPVEGFETVEMFSAMSSGEIGVLIKTKSASDANLIVTNNSNRPLAIEMPSTFSAVPVLRQIAGGGGLAGGGLGGGGVGGGGFGGGGQGGGGQAQGIGGGVGGGQGGGGFGGGGQGGGGLGGGGGVFNIPPGKTGRIQLKTVCLEEGKPNPRVAIEYTIQPLEKLNSDPRIAEMCRMLANDEVAQPVAQAAAWHLTDNLSWQQMLVKNRIELMDGYFERYFHPNHLLMAQQVVGIAAQRAEARELAERESQQNSSSYGVSTVGR